MITKSEHAAAVAFAIETLEANKIKLTEEEKSRVEVADFGLGKLKKIGLQILTYVNTDRVCAKELILYPHQTCPEHRHPNSADSMGKEETFRCRTGEVFLYVEGEKTPQIMAKIPETPVTVFHEIHLTAGEQYTLYPNTKHWFQAGNTPAIVTEFSTKSNDDTDIFTDNSILRTPEIV